MRFECGWVSETAADGRRILQPVPREQATSRYWPQLQVSRGLQLQSLWRIPTAAAGYNTCSVALQRNRLIRSTAGVKPQVTYSRQR